MKPEAHYLVLSFFFFIFFLKKQFFGGCYTILLIIKVKCYKSQKALIKVLTQSTMISSIYSSISFPNIWINFSTIPRCFHCRRHPSPTPLMMFERYYFIFIILVNFHSSNNDKNIESNLILSIEELDDNIDKSCG